MRSKNSLPVQIILPPSKHMGNRQSAHKAAFEEALHSTIEANLRSTGVSPSHIFSSLYRRSLPNGEDRTQESSIDRNGNESKTEHSSLSHDSHLLRTYSGEKEEERQAVSTPSRESSVHSIRSQSSASQNVSPFVPTPFAPPISSTPTDASPSHHDPSKWMHSATERGSQLPQLVKNIENLNEARAEQLKKLQHSQLQTWKLLQHQQQLQNSKVNKAPSLSEQQQQMMLPLNVMGTSRMPSARHEQSRSKSNLNGAMNRGQLPSIPHSNALPASPMFRKGYCKGGRDIRLSALEKNASGLVPHSSSFALVAMTITQAPGTSMVIPNDSLVVAAVSLSYLPPYQQDLSHSQTGVLAQCVGCGERPLLNFAMLASHINLRTSPVSNDSTSSVLLRRHARYFVIRSPQPPHPLIKGAIIPWSWNIESRSSGKGQQGTTQTHMQNPLPMLVAPYVNMYMAQAVAANQKQSGDNPGMPNNNMIYPSIVNKFNQLNKSPITVIDDPVVIPDNDDQSTTSNITSSSTPSKDIKVPEEVFSALEFSPVLLSVISDPTFDLHTNLKFLSNQFYIFDDIHQQFEAIWENSTLKTSSTSLKEKFQSVLFLLYLSSLNVHEPISVTSYAIFARHIIQDSSEFIINLLDGNTILNAISISQMLSVKSLASFHISQESLTHAFHSCFNAICQQRDATRHNRGGKYQVIMHVTSHGISGMCIMITEPFTSRLTKECLSLSSNEPGNSLINNVKELQQKYFHDFILALESKESPSKKLSDSSGEEGLVMDVEDDKTHVKHQMHLHNNQLQSKTMCIELMQNEFTQQVLKIIEDLRSNFNLMNFTNMECKFVLPSLHSCYSVVETAIKTSNAGKIFGNNEVAKCIYSNSETRMSSLCDTIRENSSALFVLFYFPSQTLNRSRDKLTQDIRSTFAFKNTLVIMCWTKQSLPQKTSNSSNSICVKLPEPVNYWSLLNHCASLSPNIHNETITYCEQHESKWRTMCMRNENINSYDVRVNLVLQEYLSAMYRMSKMHRNVPCVGVQDIMPECDSSVSLNVIMSLMSRRISSAIVRVPSMLVATFMFLQLREARNKLGLQDRFEIMLYNSTAKPNISTSYIKTIQRQKNYDSNWKLSSLSDLNTIPVLIILSGEVCTQEDLPSSLQTIDARLAWTSSSCSESSLESELSLAAGFYANKSAVKTNDISTKLYSPPPAKKAKFIEPGLNGDKTGSWNKEITDTNGHHNMDNPTEQEPPTKLELPRPPLVVLPKSIHNVINSMYQMRQESSTTQSKIFQIDFSTIEDTQPLLINVSIEPRSGFASPCCHFMENLHSCWKKLLEIEVFDHSCSIQATYPLSEPNDEGDAFPSLARIKNMEFTSVLPHSEQFQQSKLVQDGTMLNQQGKQHSCSIMPGKYSALNKTHQPCDYCSKHNQDQQQAELYSLLIPDIDNELVANKEVGFTVEFLLPRLQTGKFAFESGELSSIKFNNSSDDNLKTPIVSFAVSGDDQSMINLEHTLLSDGNGLLHVIVVRNCDADEYREAWPNHVLMILPPQLNDYGIGVMKYIAHRVFVQSYDAQHVTQKDDNISDDLWPFVLFLDDNCCMWWKQTSSDPASWSSTSLNNVLNTLECTPDAESYAGLGVAPWSSMINQAEQTSGKYSSQFSRCNLSSCYAININLTKDCKWNFKMFSNEDVDFSLNAHYQSLLLVQFNKLSVSTKVMDSKINNKIEESMTSLVSTADSQFELIDVNPCLLLETHFVRSGATMFESSSKEHPVLVVDGYMSFGNQICVEFVSSESSMQSTTEYGGLFLNSASYNFPPQFLHGFNFIPNSTVCVVGMDRNSLRQTVVNLQLESKWHFRLTDEFQTTNSPEKHKPLFFLTGILKR